MNAVRVLDLRAGMHEGAELDAAVEHFRAGGLLAHPTETVYGFGGPATAAGVAALRGLKGRDDEKPFLLLVPSIEAVSGLVWTEPALELARAFWPGSLTLVLVDGSGTFPPGVRSAAGGVAVRVTSHPVTRVLVERLGVPMTSSSANAAGAAPAASGDEALEVARAAGAGRELMVVDAGRLAPSPPSTVVDCTGASPVVLREGATPVHRLRCVLPGIHGKR
jgi:L-threonylcarbamoyladenylate synthase